MHLLTTGLVWTALFASPAEAGQRVYLNDPFTGIYAYDPADWAGSKTLVHAEPGITSLSAGPAANTLYFTRTITTATPTGSTTTHVLEALDLLTGTVTQVAGDDFRWNGPAALGEGRDGSIFRGSSRFSQRVDLATGAIDEEFFHPDYSYTGDLAVDPTTGLLYAAMHASPFSPSDYRLALLDFTGTTPISFGTLTFTEASVTEVGPLADQLWGLGFTLDGQLWGITPVGFNETEPATVWRIDKTTGTMSNPVVLDHNAFDMATMPYPVDEDAWDCTGTPGDADADGICDDVDLCFGDDVSGDTDGDGVCDDLDVCPLDATDDVDLDGVCDSDDACLGDDLTGDTDADQVCDDVDTCDGNDASGDPDLDGLCSDRDNCPAQANPDQADQDGDDIGDPCDADNDGDLVDDDLDNCVGASNPDQSDLDGDTLGDVCDDDDDGDGIDDLDDNCPMHANAAQADLDGDGLGDVCDGDDDADGIDDEHDRCPGTPLDVLYDDHGCSARQRIELRCGEPDDYHLRALYLVCVVHESGAARRAGLLTGREQAALIREAKLSLWDRFGGYRRRLGRCR